MDAIRRQLERRADAYGDPQARGLLLSAERRIDPSAVGSCDLCGRQTAREDLIENEDYRFADRVALLCRHCDDPAPLGPQALDD